MASNKRSEKAETGMVPEVANLGIVRPPFVYLCAIVLGLLLHFWSASARGCSTARTII